VTKPVSSYDFVGIQDNGDSVVGSGDYLVVRDAQNREHRLAVGGAEANAFLSRIGATGVGSMPVDRARQYLFIRSTLDQADRLAARGDREATAIVYGQVRDAEHWARELAEFGGLDIRAEVGERAGGILRKSVETALTEAEAAQARGDTASASVWLKQAVTQAKLSAAGGHLSLESYQTRIDALRLRIASL
jgi:hypothetical protein